MRKTIFLVINSLNGGGAERVASILSHEWGKNYRVVVFSLCGISVNDYNFNGEIVSLSNHYKGFSVFNKIKNCAKIIDKEADCYNPIAIVGFLQNANLCVALTKYQAKKIVSIRNYINKQYSGIKLIIWNYIIRHYFSRVDAVVSVSKEINDEMMEKYGISAEKCCYIYNPYNGEEIEQKCEKSLNKQQQAFFNNHTVLCNVGHLSPQKGQYILLRIFPELKKRFPNLGLVIVGNDNSEHAEKLKKMAAELCISKDILFTGLQENPFKFIKNSRLFIFPSLYEGFPNALVEAMHCNVPVIATNCKTGPKEILMPDQKSKYGFLIPNIQEKWKKFDEEFDEIEVELITIIDNLLHNEDIYEKYKLLAKERANCFSYEKIIPQWIELFER